MAARRRLWSGPPLLLFVALAFAGCVGGGSAAGAHTYVEEPLSKGAPSGVYFSLISPVPIPHDLLTQKNARLVAQAKGHFDCAAKKAVNGGHGKSAFLNGKTITVKVYGSSPEVPLICSVLKKGSFDASHLGGA